MTDSKKDSKKTATSNQVVDAKEAKTKTGPIHPLTGELVKENPEVLKGLEAEAEQSARQWTLEFAAHMDALRREIEVGEAQVAEQSKV